MGFGFGVVKIQVSWCQGYVSVESIEVRLVRFCLGITTFVFGDHYAIYGSEPDVEGLGLSTVD